MLGDAPSKVVLGQPALLGPLFLMNHTLDVKYGTQDYQTKGKKWRDRSEWIITENAHPALITKELFEQCQTVAKQRNNGGGETHKSFGTKPASPFWLRGVMVVTNADQEWSAILHPHVPRAVDNDIMYVVATCGKARSIVHM